MALSVGARLGPYEILAALGAGGMGEVYRARDSKLQRDVALKILPAEFASDPERLARFKREAQVLASLNHPHIAAIYGFEDSPSTGSGQAAGHALVLELVEGPTLADRIARGALPLDEALALAKQIAEAVEAAHEQGIIHRDLKPANIKVREDGTVKVLDFGLAKALEPASAISPAFTAAPTITTPAQMTGIGTILGTAAYMSPEQAKGRLADKRSDVWAFGCVLYEMFTGTRAFDGEDVSDTLATVLKGEPNWADLPSLVPSRIQHLLRRCLRKDSSRRLQAIGEARIVIAEVLSGDSDDGSHSQPGSTRSTDAVSWWRRAIPIVVGALVTAALAGAAWWRFWPGAAPVTVTRFSIPVGQRESTSTLSNTGRQVLSLSQDGTQLVYSADARLYVRTMAELDARPIPGLDIGSNAISPVFSLDGRSIVFWSSGDETLKRIGVTGGAPVTIARTENPIGINVSSDGILLGQAKGIVRISSNGGAPQLIVSTKSDEIAHGPQLLPGGKVVLFTLATNSLSLDRWDRAKIVAQSLASGERKVLIDGGSDARYLPTGHLVYALGGVVLAVPFDPRRLEVSGAAVPIVEGVMRAAGPATGSAQFSVAPNGTLAYIPGPVTNVAERVLALVDRKGTATSLKLPAGAIEHPRLSPDGRRVAFVTDDGKSATVWTYELSGATSMHRVTFNGSSHFPIWTDDGKRLVFQSDRDGDRGIFWQAADGSGPAKRLTKADMDTEHVPESWSPRGDGFLFRVAKSGVNTLWFFSLKDQKAIPFGAVQVQSFGPTNATFSPDGRWVAYETRTNALGSGRSINSIIYVQPFPTTGPIYQLPAIAQGGYRHPRWSPDGKELLFTIGGGSIRLRVVGVKTQPEFVFGNAESLPRPSYWLDNAGDNATQWDVLPDGQHFIIRANAGTVGQPETVAAGQQIHVVLNWFEELKQRVPTK